MATKEKAGKRITRAEASARRADDVRIRLAKIGIDERDVAAAVLWARKAAPKP